MLRSLMSGVSGARGHQTFLDVVGNNIANVNTVGFKKSNVRFQDLLYQTSRGAMPPVEGRGGVNSLQVGLGVRVAAIETIHTQGNINYTGSNTDVAIQGNGYYVLADGENRIYTRAGNFTLDSQNKIVQAGTGYRVQGFEMIPDPTDSTKFTQGSALTDIDIPLGAKMEAKETTKVGFRCNLDSRTDPVAEEDWDPYADPAVVPPEESSYSTTMEIYDSLGKAHSLEVTWVRTGDEGANQWSWYAHMPDLNGGQVVGRGQFTFGEDGKLVTEPDPNTSITVNFGVEGAADSTILLDFTGSSFDKDTIEGVTQYASPFTTKGYFQDGYKMGTLESFSVAYDGTVMGSYDNDQDVPMYRIALANFANPEGLIKVGETHFTESANSGLAQIGVAGADGNGVLVAGALELSNIDLTEEFTQLILAQRGFQASARVITTSDQVLEEQINIKR